MVNNLQDYPETYKEIGLKKSVRNKTIIVLCFLPDHCYH